MAVILREMNVNMSVGTQDNNATSQNKESTGISEEDIVNQCVKKVLSKLKRAIKER